jgi:hypothetical protein
LGHKTKRPLRKTLWMVFLMGPIENDTSFRRVLEEQENIKYSCV